MRTWSTSTLIRLSTGVILVALGAAAFAIVFRSAIEGAFRILYGAGNVLVAFEALPWTGRLLVPAAGGALAGAVGAAATRRRGTQGVGDVMEAVVLGNRRISLRVSALKAFGSLLAIISGGSIGREGPIIQFGGGLGGVIGRALSLDGERVRALIAAGTASGFAAAYNTPLAAVLFVVEVVTGVVALDVILPAIVATPIATALTRHVVGEGPIYGNRSFPMGPEVDLLAYALLGLVAGVIGPAFMAMLERGEMLFARVNLPRWLCAGAGGLAVGAISIVLPQVTGNGYEAINLILAGSVATALLVVLLVAKAVATTASVASGSPGGVFTPVLFLGAAAGSAFGHAMATVGGSAQPSFIGGYALVGMAALTAATTHAPVLSAVMVFELSGNYALVLPLLISTAVATLLSRRIRPNSIYMEELTRRGRGWDITLGGRRLRSKDEPGE